MAIIRPCPNHPVCPQINGFGFSDDPDSPVANLSSEAPDPVDFAWTKFLYNDPPINSPDNFWTNPYGTGTGTITCPPGTVQTSAGCQGYCELNPWSRGCAPVTREAETNANPGRQMFSNTEQVCVDFCDDGSQFVHSVEAGRVVATTQAQANAIALAQCQLEVSQQKICFGTSSLPGGCVNGDNYSQQILASGGTPTITGNAYFWEISSGSLPPGLTLNPTNGFITGFPTTSGSYTFTVKITDGINNSASREFTITIVEITSSSSLASGIGATAYTPVTLVSNPSGGVWALAGGSLPPGLSLSPAGVISGTPSDPASATTYSFTAGVTFGTTQCTKDFNIKIWTSDNTGIATWSYSGGTTFFVANVGPGVYKVDFLAAGSTAMSFSDSFLFCFPGRWIAIMGGGASNSGSCLSTSPILLNPIGAIMGYTYFGSAIESQNDVKVACKAWMSDPANNPLLRFEVNSTTNLTCTCPVYGAAGTPICGCSTGWSNGGELGPNFSLIRIGKP